MEDDYTVEGQYEPTVTVMRYGIGARGIDFMDKRVDDGPETKGYPIYDGRGNMIATLGQTQGSPITPSPACDIATYGERREQFPRLATHR
ncbi:MAG: hypothetical protein HND43_07455 [Armatimonadetes bacterium]|nr:hypothetical protein [Armatimonadota bacterium]